MPKFPASSMTSVRRSIPPGRSLAGTGNPDISPSAEVSSAQFNDNAWHHLVFTRAQATGEITLYIDGAPVTGHGSSPTTHLRTRTASGRSKAGPPSMPAASPTQLYTTPVLPAAT